jgi:hypothetical protein
MTRYNEELAKYASQEDVTAVAGGREVFVVQSCSGLLHYVNGTGKAFPELESAIAFAEEDPT